MSRGAIAWSVLAVSLAARPTPTCAQLPQPDGHPNLEGTWNSATATPFERPRALGDKAYFTPEEAAEWERMWAEATEEPTPEAAAASGNTGTFNMVYREWGSRVVRTLRTSIVTDPPDGLVPELTPEAEAVLLERIERQERFENPEDLWLQDRCVAFSTAGPPMLPYSYNSNYKIVQTADAIVVYAEMIHDARVIHMDGRPHVPESVRLWLGDSTGRWEADTLVVDTRNFNDGGGFYGGGGGLFGWERNLHVVERFSLLDDETLLYRFEIDDPTAFTRPWKGELTMTRSTGNIYEYACHEGNYSMSGMLRGYRAAERESAERAGVGPTSVEPTAR